MSSPGYTAVVGYPIADAGHVHPWDTILANAPITGRVITHDAKRGAEPARSVSVTPPPEEDTDEKKAIYLRLGCNIEAEQQCALIPYILAVNPNVIDKSYPGIIALTYKTWGKRVIKYRSSLDGCPKEFQIMTDDQMDAEAGEGILFDHLTKLNQIVGNELTTKLPEYKNAELWVQRTMVCSFILKLLMDWTKEWDEERRRAEGEWLSIHGEGRKTLAKKPPHKTVSPKDLLK
jgi:hypothetical protein